METKSRVRKRGLTQRAAMDATLRRGLDLQIVQRAQSELSWSKYRRVMVFLPIEPRHEIDTWPLARWIWDNHPKIRLYAPEMLGGTIEAVQITPDTKFSTTRWGIPEPVDGPVLDHSEALDLVLTPLIGFDKSGQRVGYGGGYYDRFFMRQPRARRVGLAYEALLCEAGIESEDHDIQLDAVITEANCYTFN